MGLGEAVQDSKKVASAVTDLSKITGQQPVITKASKSVAGFKLREGMPIGCKVTLRRDRMYEFLDRLITIALPRVRDFRGLNPSSFDGCGNYAMGLKEQIVFPEIDYDKVNTIRGLNITIVTSTNSSDESYALLKAFGFPIKDKKGPAKLKEETPVEESKVEEIPVEESEAEEAPAAEESKTEEASEE